MYYRKVQLSLVRIPLTLACFICYEEKKFRRWTYIAENCFILLVIIIKSYYSFECIYKYNSKDVVKLRWFTRFACSDSILLKNVFFPKNMYISLRYNVEILNFFLKVLLPLEFITSFYGRFEGY